MSKLLQKISQDFDAKYGANDVQRLSQPQITELLYRHDVIKLRQEVQNYLKLKQSLWLLFDNIDKGWPTHGVQAADLIIVRTLVEATRKIENELRKHKVDTYTI